MVPEIIQKRINDFKREHFDMRPGLRRRPNELILHKSTSPEHQTAVKAVYNLLRKLGYEVYCEPHLKYGVRPDMVVPELPAIIEVRKTETDKATEQKMKKLPASLRSHVHTIDT